MHPKTSSLKCPRDISHPSAINYPFVSFLCKIILQSYCTGTSLSRLTRNCLLVCLRFTSLLLKAVKRGEMEEWRDDKHPGEGLIGCTCLKSLEGEREEDRERKRKKETFNMVSPLSLLLFLFFISLHLRAQRHSLRMTQSRPYLIMRHKPAGLTRAWDSHKIVGPMLISLPTAITVIPCQSAYLITF